MSAASRSDAERDIKACGQRDDAQPFPWEHVRKPKTLSGASRTPHHPSPLREDGVDQGEGGRDYDSRRAEGSASAPFLPEDMQAVAVALFGECRICKALLEVDGSCPAESSHEKHVCPDCGAESVEPLSVARPCLFENEHGRRHAAE